MIMRPITHRFFCFALLGIVGILPFFAKPEPPEPAIKQFADMFVRQDAEGILKSMHADMVTGTDLTLSEIENLLKRYRANLFKFEKLDIQKRMKAEDESTQRVQVELTFKGPILAKDYRIRLSSKWFSSGYSRTINGGWNVLSPWITT